MEFLFSGQWLDESNESAILELVLLSDGAWSCVGVASQTFRWDYFSRFGWCPQKLQNFYHPWKFAPIRYILTVVMATSTVYTGVAAYLC